MDRLRSGHEKRWIRLRFCVAVVLLACSWFAGCDGASAPAAPGGNAADGLANVLGQGEVRAGMITDKAELLSGRNAAGIVGDYKIYNSKVAFVIGSPGNAGVGWVPWSGNLIDADWARGPGEEGQDCLWDYSVFVGTIRGFMGRSVEVVEAQVPGQEAVIRVYGKDGGVPLFDRVVPTKDYGVDIVQEYVLRPDVNYLLVRTTLKNKRQEDRFVVIGDLPMWADSLAHYAPGSSGDAIDGHQWNQPLPYLAGINRGASPISYSLAPVAPEARFWVPYIDTEFYPSLTVKERLAGSGSLTVERYFIVGDGGTSLIDKTLNALCGRAGVGTLEGNLDRVPEGVRDDVRIRILDASRPDKRNAAGMLIPDVAGAFSTELIKGNYRLLVRGAAEMESLPVDVAIHTGEVTRVVLPTPRPAVLRYEVTEEGLGPTPCKIVFQQGYDAAPDAPVVHTVWSATGEGAEQVRPGSYTVTAARGFEYEIDSQDLTLVSGEETPFSAKLVRSVDTTGFMTGDFHLHSEFSVDSQIRAEHRVRCLMAEAIEMPVFTDHDFCADYSGIVRGMGVGRYLVPVTGNEVSPAFGHFNAWPMTPPAGAPDYFGVRLVEYDDNGVVTERHEFPRMWKIARDEFGAKIIQINHPRSDSGGWFQYVGYDRERGLSSAKKKRWSPDFDAIEVFNSGSWSEDYGETLPDWFSFLNQGLAYTATGNSDSHTAKNTAGYPRNLFAMPTDDPEEADPADMIESILSHRNVISGGPFIRFETQGGASVGDLVTRRIGPIRFSIRVEAPTWMELDTVQLIGNGEVVRVIDPSGDGVVRADEIVTVEPKVDTWYVVLALDTLHTLGPVNPGERIFAITNPIWIDRNGNGEFDPPGVR